MLTKILERLCHLFSEKTLKEWDDTARIIDLVFFFMVFLFLREHFAFLMREQFPHLGEHSNWTHRWIPQDFPFSTLAKAVAYFQVLMAPFLLFFLNWRGVRILLFVLIVFNVTTRVNYFDAHNFHLYFYIGLLSVLFANGPVEAGLRLRLAQVQVLVVYFLSGVWKLTAFIRSLYQDNVPNTFEQLSYMVSQEYINSNTLYPLGELILAVPWIGALGHFLILVMEIGALPILLFPQFYPLWGLVIVGFHTFAWIAMGLFFRDTQALVFCILVLPSLVQWRLTGPPFLRGRSGQKIQAAPADPS